MEHLYEVAVLTSYSTRCGTRNVTNEVLDQRISQLNQDSSHFSQGNSVSIWGGFPSSKSSSNSSQYSFPISQVSFNPSYGSFNPSQHSSSSSHDSCVSNHGGIRSSQDICQSSQSNCYLSQESFHPIKDSFHSSQESCHPNKDIFPSSQASFHPIKDSFHSSQESFPPNKDIFPSSQESFHPIKDSFHSSLVSFHPNKDIFPSSQESFHPIKDSFHSSQESFHPIKDSFHSSQESFHHIKDSFHSSQECLHTNKDIFPSSQERLYSSQDSIYPSQDILYSSQDSIYPSQDILYSSQDSIYSSQCSFLPSQSSCLTSTCGLIPWKSNPLSCVEDVPQEAQANILINNDKEFDKQSSILALPHTMSDPMSANAWTVVDAQSVSNYSSEDSLWSLFSGRDTWSSSSLSLDSVSQQSYTGNCSSATAPNLASRQTGFFDIAFGSNDNSQDKDHVVISKKNANVKSDSTCCPDSGGNQGPEDLIDSRIKGASTCVTQDLFALSDKQEHCNLWQTPLLSSRGDLNSEPSLVQPKLFTNSTEEKCLLEGKDLCSNLEIEHLQNVLSEGDLFISSVLDSGQVSRSSSLCSLFATMSSTSEDNLADVESNENLEELRKRKSKRKIKRSNSLRSVCTRPVISSTTNKYVKTELDMPFREDVISLRDVDNVDISSSGCFDGVTSHSVSSDSEMSTLNPYSKPFIPRAYINSGKPYFAYDPIKSHHSEGGNFSTFSTDNDSTSLNHCKKFVPGNHLQDSGIGNSTFNITLNETGKNNISGGTFTDNTFFNNTPSRSCNDGNRSFTMNNLWKDAPVPYVKATRNEEISAYFCTLDHGSDFTPVQQFNIHKIPPEFKRYSTLEAIFAISQRVVKLRIRKPFKTKLSSTLGDTNRTGSQHNTTTLFDKEDDQRLLEHYGTGFACHVDAECIVIRTHSEVVGCSLEASNTEVTFHIMFPDREQSRMILCTGQSDGFSSSPHSQSTMFMCRTPVELLPYLHLLKNVPVVRRSSLFYDSCYFTDSSPDTSVTEDSLDQSQQSTAHNETTAYNVSRTNSNINSAVRLDPASYNWRGADPTYRPNLPLGIASKEIRTTGGDSKHEIRNNSSLVNDSHTDIYRTHQYNGDQILSYRRGQMSHHEFKVETQLNTDIDMLQYPIRNDAIMSLKGTSVVNSLRHPSSESNSTFSEHYRIHNSGFPLENVDEFNRRDIPGVSQVSRLQEGFSYVASPLAIMERRHAESMMASGGNICPYAGQPVFGNNGNYNLFSSFAGDVFASCAAGSTHKNDDTLSDELQDTGKWEFEALIFLQGLFKDANDEENIPVDSKNISLVEGNLTCDSSQPSILNDSDQNSIIRDDSDDDGTLLFDDSLTQDQIINSSFFQDHQSPYHNINPPSVSYQCNDVSTGDRSIDSLTSKINEARFFSKDTSEMTDCSDSANVTNNFSRDIFEEFSSRATYMDTWDKDLLNLDEDLKPLPQFDFVHEMIERVLADDEDDLSSHLNPACCPQTNLSNINSNSASRLVRGSSLCLVISFPHGGQKVISTGFFSQHYHVGGILYDTPTCMGSCGAPVLALTDDVPLPYVTHFVHSGTVKVNNVYAGAGVACFDTPVPTFT